MLKAFKQFIKDLTGPDLGGVSGPARATDDTRLAAAALMFHVIAADGVVQKEENDKLHAVLSSRYDVSYSEIDQLIEQARKADSEAVDLYSFTSVLKRRLSYEARTELVEHLWEMVFADGEIHEFEDNIVWRVAELVGVNREDRLAMKQKVLAQRH